MRLAQKLNQHERQGRPWWRQPIDRNAVADGYLEWLHWGGGPRPDLTGYV